MTAQQPTSGSSSTLDPTKTFDDGRVVLGPKTAASSQPQGGANAHQLTTTVDPKHFGRAGRHALLIGKHLAMTVCQHEVSEQPTASAMHSYDLMGYVLGGRADLSIGANVLSLTAGDAWLVPSGATYRFKVSETFTTLEITSSLEQPPESD